MGIPKFFRFMSERYPLIHKIILENKIPEFDNLYLDMNGIIHNCSHPNDGDAHFRITEEQIFVAIFGYIEHLFAKIKPKKLFFMAIDGVAPRAKMNQQRSRRFRTAKEAKEIRDRALRKGEELPKEAAFDSNAITPGTPFMARLSEQLKWFVNKKISEDADWKGVMVVLSGHDVPGEGEHKIMEYIRHAKAQPDYNPNVRHCLYGLDADLIMLGLLSHDPHFALLREEVTFGPKRKQKNSGNLESTDFYLLHLSLFREYLDLEFNNIELVGFEYDLERIIDDFILLAMLVGNDFLPHLPGLHINEGALPLLFSVYKQMLPTAGGYINEHGHLNLERFQKILDGLSLLENQEFEETYADMNWFKGRQKKHIDAMEKARAKAKLGLTMRQREIYEKVKGFVRQNSPASAPGATLILPANLPARDRRFLQTLASDLSLSCEFDDIDEQTEEPIIRLSFGEALGMDSEDEYDDAEAKMAVDRVLAKYDKAPTHEEPSESDIEEEYHRKLETAHKEWKRDYYREKLEFDLNDEQQMHNLVYRYIEGLQWVLHYYYDGVVSWEWYYDYHYAPKISDLQNIAAFSFKFSLGQPFRPFEQLMGVLPDLSRTLIPEAFRDLMSDPASPIIDFYPRDFVQDLNGKKQDWEAVVKIPFIDEKRLLKTMATREHRLTPDEKERNQFGTSWRFVTGPPESAHLYPSSLSGFFPDLLSCVTLMEAFNLPTMEGLHFIKGLCEGVLLGKDAIAGFPSLHTIPHSGQLGYHAVKVFQQESKGETMVLHLENPHEGFTSNALAEKLIGQPIYVQWPYLQEGQVAAISDELFRYEAGEAQIPHRPDIVANWRKVTERIGFEYSKRSGVVVGDVDVILHVRLLKGLKRTDDGALVREFEEKEVDYALQTSVTHVFSQDERFIEREALPIEQDFPEDSNVFFLGGVSYGAPARVIGHEHGLAALRYAFLPSDRQEAFLYRQFIANRPHLRYAPSHVVSRKLRVSALCLSKVTSSFMIRDGEKSHNIGLNLKFDAKGRKVLGYTRKTDNGWEYSDKAIELIGEYKTAFPTVFAATELRHGPFNSGEDVFPQGDVEKSIAEVKKWLVSKGIGDLEAVPLHAEQLEKDAVMEIERMADTTRSERRADQMQMVVVRNIPRRCLLKPEAAESRLQNQQFMLGDRVVQVQDTGNVPLCNKGVVVGVLAEMLDVVWDQPFIGGNTLGGRCSAYRGQTVTPTSLLNLTQPQFIVSRQQQGTQRAARGQRGALPRSDFRPAPKQPTQVLNRPTGHHSVNGGHSGRGPATGNYGAAAAGRTGEAYAPRTGPSGQAALLQQTLTGRPPRQDFSAVPPPAILTRGTHRGAPRGQGATRGNIPARGHVATNGAAPRLPPSSAPAVTPQVSEVPRGRGTSRGEGRGRHQGRARGHPPSHPRQAPTEVV